MKLLLLVYILSLFGCGDDPDIDEGSTVITGVDDGFSSPDYQSYYLKPEVRNYDVQNSSSTSVSSQSFDSITSIIRTDLNALGYMESANESDASFSVAISYINPGSDGSSPVNWISSDLYWWWLEAEPLVWNGVGKADTSVMDVIFSNRLYSRSR